MTNDSAYKAVIIGGGLAGSIAAAAMRHIGITPILVEQRAGIDDTRTTAISYAAAQYLERIGIWQDVPCSKIEAIEITDYHSSHTCNFIAQDIDKEAFGYIVENKWLREKAQSIAGIKPVLGTVTEVVPQGVVLSDNRLIGGDIVLAADGRLSPTRKMIGIAAPIKDYGQSAVVGVINHTEPHNQKAYERFLPGGPLALLPLKGGQQSAMVWSERNSVVESFQKMPTNDFNTILNERFGNNLGQLSLQNDLVSYPLTVVHAQTYGKVFNDIPIVLVGDAAHGIHPIAGQGFNLSLRDLEFVQQSLSRQTALGLPIDGQSLIEAYNNQRRLDNSTMVTATHLLNNLFIDDRMIMQRLRKIGLYGVEKLPPLKQFFMRYAMGLSGAGKVSEST